MNPLNENELAAVSGGEMPVSSWPSSLPGINQDLMDQIATQQQAAYDAWLRALAAGLAD